MNADDVERQLAELQAKVREGEQARQQLAALIQRSTQASVQQHPPAGVPTQNWSQQAPPQNNGIGAIHGYQSSIQQQQHQQQQQPGPSRPPANIPPARRHLPQTQPPYSNQVAVQQTYQSQHVAPQHLQNGVSTALNGGQGVGTQIVQYHNVGHQNQNTGYPNLVWKNTSSVSPIAKANINPYINLVQASVQNQARIAANTSNELANRLQQQANQMGNAAYAGNASQYTPSGQVALQAPMPQRPVQQQQPVAQTIQLPPPQRSQPLQVTAVPPLAQPQQHQQTIQRPSPSSMNNGRLPPDSMHNHPPPAAVPTSNITPTRVGPPQPTSSTSTPQPPAAARAAGQVPKNFRRPFIPAVHEDRLPIFIADLEAWSKRVDIGASINMHDAYQFEEGYAIVKQTDGVHMVDIAGGIRWPINALYRELDKRKIRKNARTTAATQMSAPAQAQATSQAQRPVPRPPTVPATAPSAAGIVTFQGQTVSTPAPRQLALPPPRAANKKTLAKDILIALGKRSRTPVNETMGPDPKRVAIPNLVNTYTWVNQSSPNNGIAVQLPTNPVLPRPHTPSMDVHAEVGPSTLPSLTLNGSQVDTATQPIQPRASSSPAQSIVGSAQPSSSKTIVTHSVEEVPGSPSMPPIVTIDEPALSSPSRSLTPPPIANKARSPSVVESEVAVFPPSSSSPDLTVAPLAPSSSRNNSVPMENKSSPNRRDPSVVAASIVHRSATPEDPLFLPSNSVPSSPSSTTADIAALHVFSEASSERSRGKRRAMFAYVLIPPPSPRTARAMKLPQASLDVPRPPSRISRRSSSRGTTATTGSKQESWPEEEEEYDYSFDAQGNKIEDLAERQLMEIACTRLKPLPCKWNGCDVVTNSVIGLLTHLKKQHRPSHEARNSKTFTCMWSQCGRHSRLKDKHLVNHALNYLECPHTGCDDLFRTVGQLRRHVEKHADNVALKPSCKIFPPTMPAPPPACPDIVPGYMAIAPVAVPSITPAKHAELCPRVLKASSGMAKIKQPRQRRSRPMKGLNAAGPSQGGLLDRYTFITEPSTRYSSYVSEPADGVRVDGIPDNAEVSQLSLAGRLRILEPGTRGVTVIPEEEMMMESEVKEESRENTPFLSPLFSSPPASSSFRLMETGSERGDDGPEEEMEQRIPRVEDEDDSDVVASMLFK